MKAMIESNQQLTNQEAFVKAHRQGHKMISFYRIIIFTVFLTLWELASYTGIIDSFFFSSPSKVVLCFLELVTEKSLFMHIGVTLFETLLSFLLVLIIDLRLWSPIW